MERGEASSGHPQKPRPRKRPSDQSDEGSNLGSADRLNRPKSNMAQPRSEARSTRNSKNALNRAEPSQSRESQNPHRSSSPSTKPRSDQTGQGSSLGNLAQSIADRSGSVLLAAAAAAGTFLISRWLGGNGWPHRSFGRGSDGESFIPGGSWAEAQVRANRNEASTREPAQHTGMDRGGVDTEAGFEVAEASQHDALAQVGDKSDRVEGTAVYDSNGQQIGRIRRLMIAKVGGRVLYAIMEFDDLLGDGTDEYAIPWTKLEYDTTLEGYRTNITQEQFQNAPEFSRDQNYDWSDQQSRRDQQSQHDLPHYYEVPIHSVTS
jgi:hypothetical protein